MVVEYIVKIIFISKLKIKLSISDNVGISNRQNVYQSFSLKILSFGGNYLIDLVVELLQVTLQFMWFCKEGCLDN